MKFIIVEDDSWALFNICKKLVDLGESFLAIKCQDEDGPDMENLKQLIYDYKSKGELIVAKNQQVLHSLNFPEKVDKSDRAALDVVLFNETQENTLVRDFASVQFAHRLQNDLENNDQIIFYTGIDPSLRTDFLEQTNNVWSILRRPEFPKDGGDEEDRQTRFFEKIFRESR